MKHVLIMAGGTGGHVFPGLAIADHFRKQGVEVSWLGTKKGLEARLVPLQNIPLHFISIQGVRGKTGKDRLFFPWRLMKAVFQAIQCIRNVNPDIIIGLGGFVSGPGGIAAFLLRKKLVIHEQNAKPGFTNLYLAPLAKKVLEAFPQTFAPSKRAITVGNPVRESIAALKPPGERLSLSPRLLVMGGSLGAQIFNTILPQALAKIPREIRPTVCHQTGEKNLEDTVKAYELAEVSADIIPFISEMDKAYAAADMVLCRAGALTITELCTAGLGAILVPYPHAVDDHQTANALFMVRENAAYLLPQSEFTEAKVADLLSAMCRSADKRIQMAKAAYDLRVVDAAERIFTICQEVCH